MHWFWITSRCLPKISVVRQADGNVFAPESERGQKAPGLKPADLFATYCGLKPAATPSGENQHPLRPISLLPVRHG